MDELLKQVILGAPNVAVALITLYWCFRALDRKDEQTQKLIDKLIDLCAHIENGAAGEAK